MRYIPMLLALMMGTAYAQQGVPPIEIESGISATDTSFIGARILKEGTEIWEATLTSASTTITIHKATDSGKGIPCSSVRRTRTLGTPWMVSLNYIGLSHPSPSHPISM